MPVVIGARGAMLKELIKRLENFETKEKGETIQTTA